MSMRFPFFIYSALPKSFCEPAECGWQAIALPGFFGRPRSHLLSIAKSAGLPGGKKARGKGEASP
jgi:hypothetical protein